MVRSLIERLSRGYVVRRTLPARVGGGPVWLSPESALRYWLWNLDHPKHSKLLVDIASRYARRGQVMWDIGANCGVFTTACSAMMGSTGFVLAVEPDTVMAACLHRNAALATAMSRAPITVLECAVSRSVGTAVFNVANRGRATSFLASAGGRSDTGGVRVSRRVVTVSLDWLTQEFPLPNLVKIDIEGAELACIEGAASVLSRARPIILIEVSEHTRGPIVDILQRLDYRFHDADRAEAREEYSHCANLLAVPADYGT
jgi:FkbM family methyltransferase